MISNNKVKTILVTGASGMIGSATVKRILEYGYNVVGIDLRECNEKIEHYKHYVVDLSDKEKLKQIISDNSVDRIIHLAALAHSSNNKKYKWENYRHINIDCAKNVFCAAGDIPVLFISTVDVFGFAKGIVNAKTEVHPVSHYAKSKAIAEDECRKLPHFTIFRFSPVYTDSIKRDIQKRYYLKYPNIAYRIGRGTEYEILHIKRAVDEMVTWCKDEPNNDIKIIKDQYRMSTADFIKKEKCEGRAKYVFYFPRWIVLAGYTVLKCLTGKNKYTYLLNKAVNPLRTE